MWAIAGGVRACYQVNRSLILAAEHREHGLCTIEARDGLVPGPWDVRRWAVAVEAVGSAGLLDGDTPSRVSRHNRSSHKTGSRLLDC